MKVQPTLSRNQSYHRLSVESSEKIIGLNALPATRTSAFPLHLNSHFFPNLDNGPKHTVQFCQRNDYVSQRDAVHINCTHSGMQIYRVVSYNPVSITLAQLIIGAFSTICTCK